MIETLLDKIGDSNPQLLRELKGRVTQKKAIISLGISAIGQLFFYFNFANNEGVFYSVYWNSYLFITLSIVGIICLSVGGVYLLIDDLYQEEKRGTLDFIRLSPQTSKSILLGKILGVPILVYLGILFAVPLHFGLGISMKIPLHLIIAFYSIVAVGCFLFYSAALLFALSYSNWKGSPASSGSIVIFIFTLLFALRFLVTNRPFSIGIFNWISIFYPGHFLPFLLAKIPHSGVLENDLGVNFITKLTWFGLPFWSNAIAAFSFIIINYFIVIAWLWHGIDRRFRDRNISLLNKKQSYWLSSSLMFILVGYSLQDTQGQGIGYDYLLDNYSAVLICQFLLLCGLIIVLSPHHKTLQTWSRYRHQTTTKNLLKDLIFGEKSPATLAIALHSIFTSIIILLTAFFVSSLPDYYIFDKYRVSLTICLSIGNGVILLYASLVQWILLQKTKHRVKLAIFTIKSLCFIPFLIAFLPQVSPSNPLLFITSILPIFQSGFVAPNLLFALIGQTMAIALINLQMTRQLRHLGASEMKELLSENSSSRKQLSEVS
jgi:hypothetical protein